MNNQKKRPHSRQWLMQAKKLCTEVRTEDGIDPRLLARQHEENQHTDRKIHQLCKETARLVSLVLNGEVSDPLIQDLQVLHVSPESNGQYLIITLYHHDIGNVIIANQILERLQRLAGYLRAVIAQSVCRKRVPHLKFKLNTHGNEVTQ